MLAASLFLLLAQEPAIAAERRHSIPCAATCLYAACERMHREKSLSEILAALGSPRQGGSHTLTETSKASERLGLFPLAVKGNYELLQRMCCFSVLHLSDDRDAAGHFVLLVRAGEAEAQIVDGNADVERIRPADLVRRWTGYALLLFADGPSRDDAEQRLSTHRMTNWAIRWMAVAGVLNLALWAAPWRRGMLRMRLKAWPIIGLIAAGFIGVGLAVLGRPAASVRSGVAFQDARVALGLIKESSKDLTLTVINAEGKDVVVNRSTSSCGCLQILSCPKALPAGQCSSLSIRLLNPGGAKSSKVSLELAELPHPVTTVVSWQVPDKPSLSTNCVSGRRSRSLVGSRWPLKILFPQGVEGSAPTVRCSPSEQVSLASSSSTLVSTHHRVDGMVMKAISELDIEVAVRPKKGLGRVREIVCLHVDYLGETYQLWLLVDVSFLPKDLLPDQDSVLFSAAKAGELAGQTRRVKIVDERCGGEVRLAGVPDWLEAKLEWAGPCPANALNQKPTRLGYVEFKLLRPPPTEFAQAEVRLERPDDPEATCPLTVIAYGAKE